MVADFFSTWNLYYICHITNSFYRRMVHKEDERPPNEKSHAYNFSITYNGCDFCLLTPSAFLALPKGQFKGWRLKFRGFICLRSCSRHCNWNWSALHKDEHKEDAKHKKLLNLLCIDYNTPRCRQNIVCVESEVIGSDESTIKLCCTCPVLRKFSKYSM